jgi:rhodanese-related sulfurtransferase
VAQRLAEIDRDREIVVQCRSGAPSQGIVEYLAQHGYPNVKNLAGRILAWADQIDPKIQKYENQPCIQPRPNAISRRMPGLMST